MRIAQIAPLAEAIPPTKYGGTERVVHTLTEELVRRGHEVTLFATGNSKTSAKLVSVYPKGLRETNAMETHGFLYSMMNMGLAYQIQDQFDIIHDHNVHFSLPTASIAKIPTVATLHGPFDKINRPYFNNFTKNVHLVAISKSQAKIAPELGIQNIIYNGLDMKGYPFSQKHDGYILFVGRISREKGVHFAIEAAEKLNTPLIMAAKVDGNDTEYFKKEIEPRLSNQIRWIGEVNESERNKLMVNAACMVHPTNWPEPFGLTLIEAMGCGCPVVAFNLGSIPEIIQNGKTGFVINPLDVEGLMKGIVECKTIDRSYCRKYALEHFSEKKMTDKYEELYEQILTQQNKPKFILPDVTPPYSFLS
jgi:glycosyltransferase involved in cell wall biosynthesis